MVGEGTGEEDEEEGVLNGSVAIEGAVGGARVCAGDGELKLRPGGGKRKVGVEYGDGMRLLYRR